MPNLVLTTPEFGEQRCALPDGRYIVGRSHSCHIIIKDDSISAEHCELLIYGSEVIVRERGSRNGTFVNGVRVKAQSAVYNGQKIRFGRVEARLELDLPEGNATTAITAMDLHRKITAKSAEVQVAAFPLIFSPTSPLPGNDS